jgi:hypothetical protein
MLDRARELEGHCQSTNWREPLLGVSVVSVMTGLCQGVAHYTFAGVTSQR